MTHSNPLPIEQNHGRVRALIVDDTPQVRRDLHQFLELTGAIEVVAEAADGQEAVRLAVELSPDVILLDLEMPGMDGFEATRQIKAKVQAVRIVILSMHADLETVARARSAGADVFIVKGADFQVLISAICGQDETFKSNEKGEKS